MFKFCNVKKLKFILLVKSESRPIKFVFMT